MNTERKPIDYGYGRCSTLLQDYEYEKKELLKYDIKEENIYLEYGSGADKNRPELNKLLNLLQPGDSLRVTDITRLSRSTSHFCSILDIVKERHLIDFKLVVHVYLDEKYDEHKYVCYM